MGGFVASPSPILRASEDKDDDDYATTSNDKDDEDANSSSADEMST